MIAKRKWLSFDTEAYSQECVNVNHTTHLYSQRLNVRTWLSLCDAYDTWCLIAFYERGRPFGDYIMYMYFKNSIFARLVTCALIDCFITKGVLPNVII